MNRNIFLLTVISLMGLVGCASDSNSNSKKVERIPSQVGVGSHLSADKTCNVRYIAEGIEKDVKAYKEIYKKIKKKTKRKGINFSKKIKSDKTDFLLTIKFDRTFKDFEGIDKSTIHKMSTQLVKLDPAIDHSETYPVLGKTMHEVLTQEEFGTLTESWQDLSGNENFQYQASTRKEVREMNKAIKRYRKLRFSNTKTKISFNESELESLVDHLKSECDQL